MSTCFIQNLSISVRKVNVGRTENASTYPFSNNHLTAKKWTASAHRNFGNFQSDSPRISRRQFLTASFAVTLATLLPSIPSLATASKDDLLFDTRNRSLVPSSHLQSLLKRDAGSLFDRVIVSGEIHDSVTAHNAQLAIIDAARNLPDRRPVVLGLEQFYRSHDDFLAQYVDSKISLEELLERTKWSTTWGYDVSLYQPIFEYCREHSVPMCGLNVSNNVTEEILQVGISDLPIAIKRSLPSDMDFDNVQHFKHFRDLVVGGHDLGPHADVLLNRYYQVQVLWEEWMSQSAAYILQSHPDFRVIALVGSGHVERRFGFPDRLEKRIHERPYTIIPVPFFEDSQEDDLGLSVEDSDVADLLWYTYEF